MMRFAAALSVVLIAGLSVAVHAEEVVKQPDGSFALPVSPLVKTEQEKEAIRLLTLTPEGFLSFYGLTAITEKSNSFDQIQTTEFFVDPALIELTKFGWKVRASLDIGSVTLGQGSQQFFETLTDGDTLYSVTIGDQKELPPALRLHNIDYSKLTAPAGEPVSLQYIPNGKTYKDMRQRVFISRRDYHSQVKWLAGMSASIEKYVVPNSINGTDGSHSNFAFVFRDLDRGYGRETMVMVFLGSPVAGSLFDGDVFVRRLATLSVSEETGVREVILHADVRDPKTGRLEPRNETFAVKWRYGKSNSSQSINSAFQRKAIRSSQNPFEGYSGPNKMALTSVVRNGDGTSIASGTRPSSVFYGNYGLQFARVNWTVYDKKGGLLSSHNGFGKYTMPIGPFAQIKGDAKKGFGLPGKKTKFAKKAYYFGPAQFEKGRVKFNKPPRTNGIWRKKPYTPRYVFHYVDNGAGPERTAACPVSNKAVRLVVNETGNHSYQLDHKKLSRNCQHVYALGYASAPENDVAYMPTADDVQRRRSFSVRLQDRVRKGEPINGQFYNPSPDNRWIYAVGYLRVGNSVPSYYDRGLESFSDGGTFEYDTWLAKDTRKAKKSPRNASLLNSGVVGRRHVYGGYDEDYDSNKKVTFFSPGGTTAGELHSMRQVRPFEGSIAAGKAGQLMVKHKWPNGDVTGLYKFVRHEDWTAWKPDINAEQSFEIFADIIHGPFHERTKTDGSTIATETKGFYYLGNRYGTWEAKYPPHPQSGMVQHDLTFHSLKNRDGIYQELYNEPDLIQRNTRFPSPFKAVRKVSNFEFRSSSDARPRQFSIHEHCPAYNVSRRVSPYSPGSATLWLFCEDWQGKWGSDKGEWATQKTLARIIVPIEQTVFPTGKDPQQNGYFGIAEGFSNVSKMTYTYEWDGGKPVRAIDAPLFRPASVSNGFFYTPKYTGPVNNHGQPDGTGETPRTLGTEQYGTSSFTGDARYRMKNSKTEVMRVTASAGVLVDVPDFDERLSLAQLERATQQRIDVAVEEQIARDRNSAEARYQRQLAEERAQERARKEKARAEDRAFQARKRELQRSARAQSLSDPNSFENRSRRSQAQLDQMRQQNNKDLQNYQRELERQRAQEAQRNAAAAQQRREEAARRNQQQQEALDRQRVEDARRIEAQRQVEAARQQREAEQMQKTQQSAGSGAPAQLPNRNQPVASSGASVSAPSGKRCNTPGSPAFGAKDDCGYGRWLDNTTVMPPGSAEGDEHCVQTSTPIGVNAIEVRLCGRGSNTYYQIYNRMPYEAAVCYEYIGGTMSSATTNQCNLGLKPGWNSKVFESRLDPLQGGLDRFTFTRIFFMDGQQDN